MSMGKNRSASRHTKAGGRIGSGGGATSNKVKNVREATRLKPRVRAANTTAVAQYGTMQGHHATREGDLPVKRDPRRDDFAVRWSHSLCTFPDIQRRATWPLFAGDVCTRRSPGSPTRSEPRGPINFDVDRRDAPAANYASGEQHHPWRCAGPFLLLIHALRRVGAGPHARDS